MKTGPGLGTSAVVFLTLSSILFLNIGPVKADPGPPVGPCPQLPPPGIPPPCFPNLWAPYGPMVKTLQFKFYGYAPSEFQDFQAGHLDIVDTPTDPTTWSFYDNNHDFLQTPLQADQSEFGIYFNGASSRFTASQESPSSPANGPFWGCDWNTGISFTINRQTYVSQCGVNMRQAFMHLFDRVTFASNRHLFPLACDNAIPKDPSCVPVSQQCAWDAMFPSCIDAYRIAPSGGDGAQQIGSPDFCAAADHMIAAGVANGAVGPTDSNGHHIPGPDNCVLTGVKLEVFANPLRFFIRSTTPRSVIGNEFITAVNNLFGGVAIHTVICGGIRNCGIFQVFTDPPVSRIDDWDVFTYGLLLNSPFPDHLYYQFNSSGATNYCGGSQNGFPSNNQFVCNPAIDTDTSAATHTADLQTFRTDSLNSLNDLGKYAVDMPIYANGFRTVALHTATGLVNGLATGYSNAWTLLNAHQDTNYPPIDPRYAFGGGDPTLRYGQAGTTYELNIFNAQFTTDFNVLGQVYDTLLTSNPVVPSQIFCWMCDSSSSYMDSKGNEHFVLELRQNLRWHDGVPVDAYDVKFSLLNFRDNSPYGVGGNLFNLLSVDILDSRSLDVSWLGASVSNLLSMEAFVIPRHLWQLQGDHTYGDVGTVDPMKLDLNYDPLATGTLIGSGPFVCQSLFPEDLGRVGTGCAKNPDGSRGGQSLDPGASIQLQAFEFTSQPGNTDPFLQYMRSYDTGWGTGTGTAAFSGQFQEFHWADQNRDAQVTISDVANAEACFGASAPTTACPSTSYNYWLRPAFHPGTPNTITTEVAVVAAHLDDAYVSPFTWAGTNPTIAGAVPYS